mgnify:FL=1
MKKLVRIGIVAAALTAFGIYWFFIRETGKVVVAAKISDEDSDKIPLINELLSKQAATMRFSSAEAKKEAMKKQYDYWMKKTLKEVEAKLKGTA